MITGRLNPAPRVMPPPPLPLLLPRPLYPSPEPTGPVPSPLPSRPSPVPLPVTFFSLARGRSRSMSSPFRNECPMAETAIHYNTSISTALLRPNTTFIMPSSAIIPSLLLFLHCCYTFIAAIPSLLLCLHCPGEDPRRPPCKKQTAEYRILQPVLRDEAGFLSARLCHG